MAALPITGDGQSPFEAGSRGTAGPCVMAMGTLRGWGRGVVLSHPVRGTACKVQMWLQALQILLLNCSGCYRGFVRKKKKNLCHVSQKKMCLLLRHFFIQSVCIPSEFLLEFFLNCTGTYEEISLWKHHGQKKK